MGHIKMVLQFGWPYLKQYWFRLVVGVAIGMLFGITNASFVWATKTIIERLEEPKPKAATTAIAETGTESAVVANSEQPPTKADVKTKSSARLKANVDRSIDPWLPRRGRELDWRQ